MTSVIRDSIVAMGDASEQASPSSSQSSISIADSVKDWWNSSGALKTATNGQNVDSARMKNKLIEYDLLKSILSNDINLKNPNNDEKIERTGNICGELLDVEIEDGIFVHEFYIENNTKDVSKEDEIHVVVVHGYMAALGYFIKNVEAIVRSRPGIRLHLIDMIGFGNSSRPKFPDEFLTEPQEKKEQIRQILDIENWFIDKFEGWRKKREIKKMKLIAHSMGAYLSACYLLKYNNQHSKSGESGYNIVDQFVVISPMGTESSYHSLINEKELQFNHHETGGDPLRELVTSQHGDRSEELVKLWEKLGQPKFPKNYVLRKIWEHKKSPFQILQFFGPMYSKILSLWSFQRFRNLQANDGTRSTDLILKLHNYSYSIFNQFQGSGELAITRLINHEILARLPLCDRGLVDYLISHKVETLWLYGSKDWMNVKGGKHIYDQIKDRDPSITDFTIIEDAGHHIYLDNPTAFNEKCLKFLNLA